MLARKKWNSIERLASKALADISHEEYQTIINEEPKYRKMREDIRMMKSQKNDELNEEGKKNEMNKTNTENS